MTAEAVASAGSSGSSASSGLLRVTVKSSAGWSSCTPSPSTRTRMADPEFPAVIVVMPSVTAS
jgi:hypothetical protein